MLYPFVFTPLLKERIWGGTRLVTLYGKNLPPNKPIGESWEISDRVGDVSVIANGPLAGRDLQWLVENCREELLGKAQLSAGRFPLLVKILDAQEVLSLQVHPPAEVAKQLGGEPKTELWCVTASEPGSVLFAGLKTGVSREEFARRISEGTVADCFHKIPVKPGDVMFLPSGRVHALGKGLVIFEIQQNSDTTYRVFDWNRKDASGQSRQLHVEQSLKSIDFNDFEPALVTPARKREGDALIEILVENPLFHVQKVSLGTSGQRQWKDGEMRVIGILSGRAKLEWPDGDLELNGGNFCLIPASMRQARLIATTDVSFLESKAGV